MILCMFGRLVVIASDLGRLYCLNLVLTFSENLQLSVESVMYVIGLCMAMFMFKSIRCIIDDNVTFLTQQLGESTKNSLSNAIYKKILKMSSSAKHDYSTGTVMNISTTDTGRFPWFYYYVEVVMAAFLSAIACLGFSIMLLGTSALIGFSVILVIVIPLSAACMIWEQKIEEIIEANQDERSQIISQLVYAMRFVKFYTMENLFKSKIMNIRDKEMKNIKKGFISDSGMNVLWNSFTAMISLVSFVHYCYIRGESLTVSVSFSFLSALDMIKYEVIYVPDALLNISKAFTSFKRIIKLLSSEQIVEIDPSIQNSNCGHDLVAEYGNASFTWDSLSDPTTITPNLNEINLKIKKGEFICIIGRVGEGKSSLLSSLLGEMNFIESQESFFEKQHDLKYAYVAQDSWIRNQTIRENILFGEEFDKERYQKVLHACNLEPDLKQISKEIGDLSMIGESGINLSGGQRLRISLARCFYSNADVYLLDDPLSSVDVHTADHIVKHGIFDLLKGKTTLMVTNQIHFIDRADRILVMDKGRIVQQGTFVELYKEDTYFKNLMDEFAFTPVGRIIARFTRDTNAIDCALNKNLTQLIPYFFFWIGGIIIVMILSPFSIISLALLSPIVFIIQSYYRVSLRELELLAGVYSSPVNSQISETIHGLQTIRAFGKQNFLIESFEKKAENEVRVTYNSHCLQIYFDIRNEIVSALCVALIIISSVLSFSGTIIGVVILQATSSFECFYYISYLFVMIEKDLVSVERIEQYCTLESEKYEPEVKVDLSELGNGGKIEMKNVCMRYKKHTFDSSQETEQNKLVLKGINLLINEKERVSVVGRTGSGKTSLIQSLMRMQEAEEDSSILIDGIDIRNLPLETLRSTICIIPQQPTLFKGTLRENLDSYSQYTDRELWNALEKVGMKDKLDQLQATDEDEDKEGSVLPVEKPTGLATEISENGENISAGTRQLLCLARALIRKSKILILDEATALCDLETDKLIQQTLRDEFSSKCTVICIAHRLETILDYDKIVVIDDGTVREIGSPSQLLDDPSSLFHAMVERHKKLH